MINKLHEIPTFSLFNNYEIIRKIKYKINEIIDAINNQPEPVEPYEVVYSTDERKIGSYFGDDLYECCFPLPEYDASNGYVIEVPGSEKIINCEGLIISSDEEPTTVCFNCVPTGSFSTASQVKSIVAFMYDKTENYDSGAVYISCYNLTEYQTGLGFAKIRYTKIPA